MDGWVGGWVSGGDGGVFVCACVPVYVCVRICVRARACTRISVQCVPSAWSACACACVCACVLNVCVCVSVRVRACARALCAQCARSVRELCAVKTWAKPWGSSRRATPP